MRWNWSAAERRWIADGPEIEAAATREPAMPAVSATAGEPTLEEAREQFKAARRRHRQQELARIFAECAAYEDADQIALKVALQVVEEHRLPLALAEIELHRAALGYYS